MTFKDKQESQSDGNPILLFEFSDGVRYWRYTDQIEAVVLSGDTFTPQIITLSKLSQSLAEGPQGFQVRLPSDDPLASEFKQYLPARPIFMRVLTRHMTDEDDEYIVPCIGECASSGFDDGFLTLLITPALYKAKRIIPWPMYSSGSCNWGVYSAGCGLDKDDFKVEATVDTVDLLTVTASELGDIPDDHIRAGMIVRLLTGEARWVVSHEGTTVTMAAPLVGLEVGESVVFYWGCDGLELTCKNKFNNLPRYFGFDDIPQRNPFVDNVFGTGNAAVVPSNFASSNQGT